MSILDELADSLARDTIAAAEELGDDNLIAEIAKELGAASQTMQEGFMTAIRVRLSERRARRFLQQRLARGPANPGGPKLDLGTKKILDTPDGDGGGH